MNSKPGMTNTQSIDGLLIARRMAQFCPTSISMADFKHLIKKPQIKKQSNEEFHPPKPHVEIIKENSLPESPLKNNRFSFLFQNSSGVSNDQLNSNSNDKSKSKESLKLCYQLPNVELIKTPNRKPGRPLMVVSLSRDVINNKKSDTQNKEDILADTTQMFSTIAKQVISDGESYDSDSD